MRKIQQFTKMEILIKNKNKLKKMMLSKQKMKKSERKAKLKIRKRMKKYVRSVNSNLREEKFEKMRR